MSERWKPEHGEDYYCVAAIGVVYGYVWRDDSLDSLHYESGNCFKTKTEAEAAAEKFKSLLLSLHEPTAECSQLPKLTTEVFDREDCPKWAKWATVDQDGDGVYFAGKPSISPCGPWWDRTIDHETIGKYDASDWKNSLIERPSKLPDWCKVGEWGYCLDDDGNCKYFKITRIEDNFIYGEDWGIDYHFVKQARLRPYNAEEMKALVGKVIEDNYSAHLVIGLIKPDPAENVSCHVRASQSWLASDKLLQQFTIDGHPCGVLEHLNEKGEWVE